MILMCKDVRRLIDFSLVNTRQKQMEELHEEHSKNQREWRKKALDKDREHAVRNPTAPPIRLPETPAPKHGNRRTKNESLDVRRLLAMTAWQ